MNNNLIAFKKNFIKIISSLHPKFRHLMLSDDNFFVGGFVRDIFINQEKTFDIDIVVNDIDKILSYFKKDLKGNVITLDADFGVYRAFLKDYENYIDISKLQGSNIVEDLNRRDFTINAIAIKLKESDIEIIDPLEGTLDIEKRVIRSISRDNLVSDPLRLLRAYRFKAQFGFSITEETEAYIKELSFLILEVAMERLKTELFKILSFENTEKILKDMDQTNLLKFLFPFVETYKNFYSGKLHSFDLFNHSMETLKNIETFLKEGFPIDFDKNILYEELEYGLNTISALKLTAFLHDIGKILTKDTISNKITFYRHDKEGSKFLKNFLVRQKFSSRSINFIEKLVRFHLYPFHIIQSSKENPNLSTKAYIRLKEELGESVPLLFVLFIADNLAKGSGFDNYLIKGAIKLYKDYLSYSKKEEETQPLLKGSEIMDILNIEPGPIVGEIILKLREMELEGKLTDKIEAQKYIKETYDKKN